MNAMIFSTKDSYAVANAELVSLKVSSNTMKVGFFWNCDSLKKASGTSVDEWVAIVLPWSAVSWHISVNLNWKIEQAYDRMWKFQNYVTCTNLLTNSFKNSEEKVFWKVSSKTSSVAFINEGLFQPAFCSFWQEFSNSKLKYKQFQGNPTQK